MSTSLITLQKDGEVATTSRLLPRHIQTPQQYAVIVAAGNEIGYGPMESVRNLFLVQGMLTESAGSQFSRFKRDGGRGEFIELNEERAVLNLVHPNGDKHQETYTLKDAEAAGLKKNDNWKKNPKAMLRSRAITAGLKSLGWSGATGIYDPSELEHLEQSPAPSAAAPRTPVEVRPKFVVDDEQQERMNKAKEHIRKCDSLDALDKARRRIQENVDSGEWTTSQGDELASLVRDRAEVVISLEETAA